MVGTMRKTATEIDDRKLESAKVILGTRTLKDTIDKALEEVIATDALRKHFEQLKNMDGLDLADPQVMREAWQ